MSALFTFLNQFSFLGNSYEALQYDVPYYTEDTQEFMGN